MDIFHHKVLAHFVDDFLSDHDLMFQSHLIQKYQNLLGFLLVFQTSPRTRTGSGHRQDRAQSAAVDAGGRRAPAGMQSAFALSAGEGEFVCPEYLHLKRQDTLRQLITLSSEK